MKLRLIAMLLGIPALVAGLLVIAPADASTPAHNSYITTRITTVTNGVAKVNLSCHSSKPCSGHLYFDGPGQPRGVYTIAGKTSRTLPVRMNAGGLADPAVGTSTPGGLYKYRSTKLYVDESGPTNVVPFYYDIRTETPVSKGEIRYTIDGDMDGVSALKLTLIRVLRGGNADEYVQDLDSGVIRLPLGATNAPSEPFVLKLSAKVNGGTRSWYWRGSDGNPAGGARSLGEATAVRATKDVYNADFTFGTISGTTKARADVEALGVPSSYSGVTFRRSLDSPSCANVFGQDVADGAGNYSIPFLPYDGDGGDERYMVAAKAGSLEAWRGADTTPYGSCSDVLNYKYSKDDLIALNGNADIDLEPRLSGSDVTIRRFYSGFTPTLADAFVRLREKVPGLAVLESPVVAEGTANDGPGNRNITFNDVPPGKYWVEVGRRTGCSLWYPSRYPNNSAYFNGADRGAEAWKSFTTLGSLPGGSTSGLEKVARDHGATTKVQGKKPGGSAGWMYREYCKAYGIGTYSDEVNVTEFDQDFTENANSNLKGAIVQGRVTRVGGKSNKEMMVRLSSSDGKRVLRTDFTDGSGYFYIAGLPSGNWEISVNSDSWRGIGRTFTGKHYIRVTAGKVYNAGTLRFMS